MTNGTLGFGRSRVAEGIKKIRIIICGNAWSAYESMRANADGH
jgi:hypothetical protein